MTGPKGGGKHSAEAELKGLVGNWNPDAATAKQLLLPPELDALRHP